MSIAAVESPSSLTKPQIKALLLEKKAALRALRARIDGTADEFELIRLNAQLDMVVREAQDLLRKGRSLPD